MPTQKSLADSVPGRGAGFLDRWHSGYEAFSGGRRQSRRRTLQKEPRPCSESRLRRSVSAAIKACERRHSGAMSSEHNAACGRQRKPQRPNARYPRCPNWRRPCQPHPGTQVRCYRCSLPGLAEFTAYCCGGTNRAAITHRAGQCPAEAALWPKPRRNATVIRERLPTAPSHSAPGRETPLPAAAWRPESPALHHSRANPAAPAGLGFRHLRPTPAARDARPAR